MTLITSLIQLASSHLSLSPPGVTLLGSGQVGRRRCGAAVRARTGIGVMSHIDRGDRTESGAGLSIVLMQGTG